MSELRQDPVSGDWIVTVPLRGKRPHDFGAKKIKRKVSPKSDCRFENLQKSGNWPPILSHPDDKNWEVVLIPNKFPALTHATQCPVPMSKGPYIIEDGVGKHDLIITREHGKNFGNLAPEKAVRVLEILQKRYRELSGDPCLLYTSAFFNWGPSAGASIYHPHYQVITLPIIPPDIEHSLLGSSRYFKRHRQCVHCDMISYDRKEKTRIIAENNLAIATAPFVSRNPYEVRVFPKRHMPSFEKTPIYDLRAVSRLLQAVIKRIASRLGDPDFNFFIHTAPLKNKKKYIHYHWHIEIFPKISIPAGFELSTGVDINVVPPEVTAEILR